MTSLTQLREKNFRVVHPNSYVDTLHSRVPGDGCVGFVAAHAAGGAVGHDPQVYVADHEVELLSNRKIASTLLVSITAITDANVSDSTE